jgi:hypothetical protein
MNSPGCARIGEHSHARSIWCQEMTVKINCNAINKNTSSSLAQVDISILCRSHKCSSIIDFYINELVGLMGFLQWWLWRCVVRCVNRRFGGTYRLHLQGGKNKFGKKPAWKQVACTLVSCRTNFVNPEDGGDMFLRKHRLTLNGLHGVISQKMVLFINGPGHESATASMWIYFN